MKRLILTTGLVLFIGSVSWAQRPHHDWGALLESVNPFSHHAGFLGVVLADVTQENKEALGLESFHGALIRDIAGDSAAEEAGVLADDVVITWDGVAVRSASQMNRLVKETPPGREVEFTVVREGKEKALRCVLQERNILGLKMSDLAQLAEGEDENLQETLLTPSGPRLGVVVMPLHKQLAEHFGIGEEGGVLVSAVQEDSVAGEVGIQAGDVLVSINGEALHSAADVTRLLVQHGDKEISLDYVRDRKSKTVTVEF